MMTSSFDKEHFDIITQNLKVIRDSLAEAAIKSSRSPDDGRLMAVTKTVCPEYINHTIKECGIDLIGENKVQEYLSKKDFLDLEHIEKHLIGHLQTNKVKKIVGEVDMIQSVDSLHLAQVIAKESLKIGKTTEVLLELNIGSEESKTGFDKQAFDESLFQISELEGICVKGLMTIPPVCQTSLECERYFQAMADYFEEVKLKKLNNFDMQILSMGMSGDYKEAVLHGSTLVRIGSAIFGPRIYK